MAEKEYKLGTKFQGDYKGKSLPGKVKEFVKTAGKQTKAALKYTPLNIKGAIKGYKKLGKKAFTKGSGTKRQAKDVPTMAAKGGLISGMRRFNRGGKV